MRTLSKVCVLLALVILLVPMAADAQRICLSFASETNTDGPNFQGIAGGLPSLIDGAALNADAVVNVRMIVQPFCDVGPISTRLVYMFIDANHYAAIQTPFVGNSVNNWAYEGRIVFFDPVAGVNFLEIHFSRSLLTAWSPTPTDITSTATWQDSFWTDGQLTFIAGSPLVNIMLAAGFPPNLINVQPDFAFTLTNVRDLVPSVVPIPFDPATGDYLVDWQADGSFSASAGI